MANYKKKEEKVIPPNLRNIQKYEEEIARLEKVREQADKDQDWCMRNFYDAQLFAKRGNLERLKNKTKANGNPI